MFFALLVIFIFALLIAGVKIDEYGWMMLVGAGYFAGYLDCRRFGHRADEDPKQRMPRAALNESPDEPVEAYR